MFSILEMMIVLIGSALLTMQGIKEDIAAKHTNLLQIEGQNQASINAALGSYITAQYGNLMAALGPNFSQTSPTPLAVPTIAQLSASSNDRVTFRSGPFWGGSYLISLTVVPSVCSVAAGTCHIASQLYSNRPLLSRGTPDIAGAGILAAAGGSQFGYSTNRNPATITGLSGQWTATNPLAAQAGTILAINGFGSDGNSPYYRRDGALPLTGTMNANNQDIQNAKDVTANSLTLSEGNSLRIGAGATYYGDSANAAIRTNGALYLQNQAGTAAADLSVGNVYASSSINAPTATLTANGDSLRIGSAGVSLYGDQNGSAAIRGSNGLFVLDMAGGAAPIQQVGNINSSGTVTAPVMNIDPASANCAWNTVTMRGANQMWVCNKYGNWTPISNLVGNMTTDAVYVGYYTGWGVTPPACGPGGSAWYRIIPATISTDYANSYPPLSGASYQMGSNGSQWVLQIYNVLADGNNSLVPDRLGLQAEIDVGCTFANN
ncbi:hypothetical protein [Caballeronia sp. dw_19]|uniref:hypothetical protein n=1 Tax=Caballeronia sp. dw_19 TaxID=2719791 RepID=UPI001BD3BA7E|nr:hypothetical protein [Caballeronia sp. dw_19]